MREIEWPMPGFSEFHKTDRVRFLPLAALLTTLLVAVCFGAFPQCAFAVKAMPGSGHEDANHSCPSHANELVTLDDINASNPLPEGGKGSSKLQTAAASNQKTLPLLIIVVGFNGTPYSQELDWNDIIFQDEYSLSTYYSDMSLGQFTFVPANETSAYGEGDNVNAPDVANDGIVHVTLSSAHGDWIDINEKETARSFGLFACDAITAADEYVDFASYDTNRDGKLSPNEIALGFIVAGYEAAVTDDYSTYGRDKYLWSHAWNIETAFSYGEISDTPLPNPDSTTVSNYIAIAEELAPGKRSPFGSLAHELGHYLGLPDLYDTQLLTDSPWSSYNVQHLCLMDAGSWGQMKDGSFRPGALSAPCREMLKWITPEATSENDSDVAVAQDYDASPENSGYQCVRIPVDGSSTDYYLVENRRYMKWDEILASRYSSAAPNGGVVLWHVDQKIIRKYPNGVNDSDHHPGIMPLFIERDSDRKPTLIGYHDNSDLPFLDVAEWDDVLAPVFGDYLTLPKYATDASNDTPETRTFSQTNVFFGTPSNSDVPIGVGLAPCAHELEHHDAVAETYDTPGNIEYWSCTKCGRLFSDELSRHKIDEDDTVIDEGGHSLEQHKAVAPTCTDAGHSEYWSCPLCQRIYLDKNGLEKTTLAKVEIAPLGHDAEHVDTVQATCQETGVNEHWKCTRCDTLFSDSSTNNPVTADSLVISKEPHDLVHHDAVSATCAEPGNGEYWICSACNHLFADESGYDEVDFATDVLIAATGAHDWDTGTVTTQPTVNNVGAMTYTCKHCGAVRVEEIPAIELSRAAKGTAFKRGASLSDVDEAIALMTTDDDPNGTVFAKLKLRSTKQTEDSIALKWKSAAGASSYVVYGNKCGKTNKLVKLATTSATSYTLKKIQGKKLAKGTYYKFLVVALDASDNVVTSSKIAYVATAKGKVTNAKGIKVAATDGKVSLKVNGVFNLKASAVKQSPKLKLKAHRKLMYESTDTSVATVTASGKIKGVGKGTCVVRIYTQNGISKNIKVTVK